MKEEKGIEDFFNMHRNVVSEKLKEEFLARIEKARNKSKFYQKLRLEFRDRYNNIQSETIPYGFPVLFEIQELMDDDSSVTHEQALLQVVKVVSEKEIPNEVRKIATLEAYNDLNKFLGDYYHENFHVEDGELREESKLRSKIYWKGENETEFIQLVYALYEAKLITNDEDKITFLVKQLAEVFQVDLGKNWQSSLTKSITERNYDYEPKIFTKLQEGFKSYVKRRLNTEEKRDKNKKS
jgi:hypothetical protein